MNRNIEGILLNCFEVKNKQLFFRKKTYKYLLSDNCNSCEIIFCRISPCDTTQICCPYEYLSSPNPSVVTETSHGGFTSNHPTYPNTNSENPVHVSEDPHKGFSSFSNEHVTYDPTEPNLSVTKTTPNPEECACVPFAHCKNDTYDQDYGRGIILVR